MSKLLSKTLSEDAVCYHSYLENHTSSAKRIFWYFYNETTIKIVGVSPHPKENSNELPKFKDLAKENLIYK